MIPPASVSLLKKKSDIEFEKIDLRNFHIKILVYPAYVTHVELYFQCFFNLLFPGPFFYQHSFPLESRSISFI